MLSLWGFSACAPEAEKAREPVVLARVGDVEITDVDCEQAVDKLRATDGDEEVTSEERKQRFQLLVDRELLLLEARSLGLEEDFRVQREMAAWERTRLIETLLQADMSDRLTWDEEELKQFFAETGAGQEIRLSRLVLTDRAQAVAALQKARSGEPFAQVIADYAVPEQSYRNGDLGWLNPLTMGNPRIAFLFQLDEGSVELVEADGLYFLMAVTGKRQVVLAERRSAVETALARKKRNEANLAYLEYLTSNYEVSLDNATLGLLLEAESPEKVDPSLRLVQSKLGDWSVGEFLEELKSFRGADTRLPDSAPELGFQVTRAYIVSQLLVEEARKKGLYAAIEEGREKVRQQKLIEALWRRQGVEEIPFTAAEFDAFYEAHKERYAADRSRLSPAEWRNRIAQDLREAKGAPLFEQYLAQLRQQHASEVSIDEKRLGEFVALED